MYEEMIRSILSELNNSSTDIEASALIFTDGLTIWSVLSVEINDDRVGTMATAMLSLGGHAAAKLARGEQEQIMIKGNNGYILLIHAGREAVLSVIVRKEAKLELVFLDANRAAQSIADLL
ncbi:Roadblock/LC7 family protein [Acidithiobacillus ferrivorans SS3]|uniref:Roadblock/LC7 family protein n=1 Tax=Acidithiobacillus ferrivorans SS3 TaxID=743299 RepID=G0JLY4_9PROT|nr:roadblock/LC7 domain-containing protein [Acidithiobacillus ferrivorans]AEM46934.1 Roadblock/LC7 family protein [Acidithiobacillus ferrivorans SS3]MBU2766913.1 hypothetical protein [Acidithiobacillus ferrivorans]OFA16403.1 hypothetical protein A4U49_07600 [Acidithiobacillus ferrivorans]UBU61495.1 roadblock/LC7 domain-containing protein [Acidithiobacillus ferrooxidans]